MIHLPPPPPAQAAQVSAPCYDAVAAVLATGQLDLPWWVEIHCPGDHRVPADKDGYAWVAFDHRSAWVAIRSSHVGNRYLVAHELCHVAYGLARDDLSEATADACAADMGFPAP